MQNKNSMDLSFCQSENRFFFERTRNQTGRYVRAQDLRRSAEDDFTDGSGNFDPSTSSWQAGYLEMLQSWSFSFKWQL